MAGKSCKNYSTHALLDISGEQRLQLEKPVMIFRFNVPVIN
jgi:hypothetical protein